VTATSFEYLILGDGNLVDPAESSFDCGMDDRSAISYIDSLLVSVGASI
jgi:hypothetical protein